MIATALRDRVLLGNGISVVEPDEIVNLMIAGVPLEKIQSIEINEELKQFNLRSDIEISIFNEDQEINIDLSWLIPAEYLQLDLHTFFVDKLINIPRHLQERAEVRILNELAEVKNRDFELGLKTIIYVVDELKRQQVIWGVGRGSSCASYLLFLLGLHCVDCLKFNIHYSEFFHD